MSHKLTYSILSILFFVGNAQDVYSASYFDPITVTTALDSLDGDTTSIANLIASPGADMKISLREAIIATNRTSGKDTIQFNIDSLDAGFNDTSWVIQQLSQYPKITDPICIDGYTQPGTQMNNLIDTSGQYAAVDMPHKLSIVLRGLSANQFDSSGIFLTAGASNSKITGLVIQNCQYGLFSFCDSLTVIGNYFGTSADGLQPIDNDYCAAIVGSNITIVNNLFTGYGGLSDTGIDLGMANSSLHDITICQNIFSCDVNGGTFGTVITDINSSDFQDYGVNLHRGDFKDITMNWNFTKYAEYYSLLTEGRNIENLTHRNNYIDSLGEAPIYFDTDVMINSNVLDNYFGYSDDYHVYFSTDTIIQLDVDNNEFRRSEYSAIEFSSDTVANVRITQNQISDVVSLGINARSTFNARSISDLLISDNTLTNVGTGIHIEHGDVGTAESITIESNVIQNCPNYGIQMTNEDSGEMKNCDIKNNIISQSKAGIHIISDNTSSISDMLIQKNTIYRNRGDGIELIQNGGSSIDSVYITQNRIFNNQGLGIDLGGEDVTLNDANDSDTGANRLQNYPVLDSVKLTNQNNTTFFGTLSSQSSDIYVIEYFLNAVCNADTLGIAQDSSYGEGGAFIGRDTVTTDEGGFVSFTTVFDTIIPSAAYISATATSLTEKSTSEFSPCVLSQGSSSTADYVWVGLEDSSWTNPLNWNWQMVPSGKNVIIPMAPFNPIISNGTTTGINNLWIQDEGHLMINTGASLFIEGPQLMTIDLGGQLDVQKGGVLTAAQD